MRFIFLIVLTLGGCVSAAAVNPSLVADLACEGARLAVLYRMKPPSPSPAQASDDCDNCIDGFVGDGKIKVKCQVCGGTGKKPKP